ncbi:MAG: hypothetical protein KDJ26_03535 [Alphaproteobacteria bacterium]|jgi:hypothetical protein|nr:hypothetical protein [Alphaproteobacteria bacterium]MCB1551055.1 hypothetical protein [Alphaproteobacteria bacterium]MCB9985503.1 hypothetical protein [Micavibrio sp.]
MSCSIIHQSVRSVLEEGRMAYTTTVEAGGVINMDYASYCCHVSLNRLRQSLDNPNISAERLEGLLRLAARKYSSDQPQHGWTDVMARFLRRHVNSN